MHLSAANVAYLSMVVGGFALFMVTLCYGWLRTAPPWRQSRAPAASTARDEAPRKAA